MVMLSIYLCACLFMRLLCDYVTATETAHPTCHTMKIVTKRIAYISVIFISAVEIVATQRSSN